MLQNTTAQCQHGVEHRTGWHVRFLEEEKACPQPCWFTTKRLLWTSNYRHRDTSADLEQEEGSEGNTMKLMQLAGVLVLGILAPSAAWATPICPPVGLAPSCTTEITILADGNLQGAAYGGDGPYNASGDQLIGMFNTTSHSISSITLSGNGVPIFAFDGDGLDTFNFAGNSIDTTGYGGQNAYFTSISSDFTSGTVNFITPISPGLPTFFSLEGPFTATDLTGHVGSPVTGVTPEPNTFLLLSTGAAGLLTSLRRRRS
jgi:hypothetical protein